MDIPKLTGREYRSYDWYGWLMCIIGLYLLYYFGSKEISLFEKIPQVLLVVFVFIEYAFRVSYGRIYKFVYYDTIIQKMYELRVGEDTYYVCSETEDELASYMQIHYPEVKYNIVDDYPVESYIKREKFQ